MTTRYPNGITNAAQGTTLGNLNFLDPTLWISYYNDFSTYASGDYTITVTGSGTTALTTSTGTAGVGGVLLHTNSAAGGDNIMVQVGTSSSAPFLMQAAKRAMFKIKFKTSDATTSLIAAGLELVNTAQFTAATVTDAIYFNKGTGAATVDFICKKNDSTGKNTKTAVATIADNTWVSLGWEYIPSTATLNVFKDDVMIWSKMDASSTYLPDTNMTVSWAIQTGSKTMSVDYVFAALER